MGLVLPQVRIDLRLSFFWWVVERQAHSPEFIEVRSTFGDQFLNYECCWVGMFADFANGRLGDANLTFK